MDEDAHHAQVTTRDGFAGVDFVAMVFMWLFVLELYISESLEEVMDRLGNM